jgi:hypothetical protein
MLPLVLLNGRTFTGCGCTGHFEAACHCGCAHAGSDCCATNGARSCCTSKSANSRLATAANSAIPAERAQGHHCKQAAQYEVVPAVTAPTAANDDFQPATLANFAIDVPTATHIVHQEQTALWNTGPPSGIVISFHRLII